MKQILVRGFFPVLLPAAAAWVGQQERRILRNGVALNPDLLKEAQVLGILEPAKVRLLSVAHIPWPMNPVLQWAGKVTGLYSMNVVGLTMGYGIYIRLDRWNDPVLVVHELAHTAQYERLGGIQPFLKLYLKECLEGPGYPFGPLEQEAREIEKNYRSRRSG